MKRLLLAACFGMLLPGIALAQDTVIQGTVTDASGEALIGANVVIEQLVLGGSTDLNGRYSFSVDPSHVGQTYTLTAKFVGYTSQSRAVTLTAGTMTQNFTLAEDVLQLEEMVVTGVTSETPQKKLAFTVDKLDTKNLELAPGANPIESMQGKVAGASVVSNSGQPGDGTSVRLRGSTSISGSSSPLYIVDGVILGSSQVDIDALDIESMEIVKGAAASSLYGARAQNRVIQITTKRGGSVPYNQTRITIRNEYGINQLPTDFVANNAHDLKIDGSGNFLDADGNVNSCATCLSNGYGPGTVTNSVLGGVSFYDNPYSASGTLTNNFEEFFDPGNTYTNYISVSQNSAKTNFHASFTNLDQQGVVLGLQGYNRKSFRMNLDHRVTSKLNFSATAFYSQSERDVPRSSGFNPFFGLMFTNPLASLSARDENGNLFVQADPLSVEENPLYVIENVDTQDDRSRVLGNLRARYSATSWLDVEGNFSYDRADGDFTRFADRGTDSIDPSTFNDGQIVRNNSIEQAINADVTASFRKTFGALTARSQLKYQAESVDEEFEFVTGNTITAVGIPDLSNVNGDKVVSSTNRIIRSDGFYGTVGGDYADKYIADFLIRRDGSSLFGAEERWQTYYRVSGAWRLSEENFWPLKNFMEEFKVRYSLGTAGGRPQFDAQYETFSLSNGQISKGTLGNAFLKPELQTEQEFGIDMGLLDRFSASVVYAKAKVEDQLLLVPLPGFFGFESQWQNAGTLESNTLEATLDASILRGRNMTLDMGFVFDRTRQEITEFNANAFRGGPTSAFYFRGGEILGAMYGEKWLTDTGELADGQGVPDGFN
ncbi:MAG TPA: SusC/RagA family TonB-linked outer membrane protein, partial [Rhodothermales bacterium]|nr:SusC/RagA family TonB-linked outer membrane protein [Rhodothermales bacterium]